MHPARPAELEEHARELARLAVEPPGYSAVVEPGWVEARPDLELAHLHFCSFEQYVKRHEARASALGQRGYCPSRASAEEFFRTGTCPWNLHNRTFEKMKRYAREPLPKHWAW
jgi:hypothetical protein